MTTPSAQKFLNAFMAARRVSTPLIAVQTPDPAATVQAITAKVPKATPLLLHDMARGLQPLNPAGKAAFQALDVDPIATTNPVDVLGMALKLPDDSILFMANAQNFCGKGDGSPAQAVWNLRDPFKATGRTLVLLTPGFRLPAELNQDVMMLSEPLPSAEELAAIVRDCFEGAELAAPAEAEVARAVDALSGLAAFPAEQVTAMSLSPTGLDFENLWERKRQLIEQTPGLSVWRGGERFSDIGGVANVKQFLQKLLKGKDAPRVIVFIDEIEKAVAGAGNEGGGDSSGVTQEMVGALLSEMQNTEAAGLILLGVPGGAKSLVAKATGAEAGVPTIGFDFSGMKAGIVGESGERLRAALRVVQAVGQGKALYIATCNSIGALSPELRRRFTRGTFFFDLPDADERAVIWAMYRKKYGVAGDIPKDEGWTGAEIKECCRTADSLGITLLEAATYIVPVAKSAADRIAKLREQATGRFISASYPGMYAPEAAAVEASAPKTAVRRIRTSLN